MVYESDFYTTRRPYSSRPTVTSYSVTVQPYHRNIPYIGHKRLVIVQPSAHGYRVKQSSLLGEIDRIYHKVRPSLAYQPTEDYLNSRPMLSFDDETRTIRAKTAEILKRIHTPVPRAQRPLPLPGDLYYSHTELPITERITSNNYIDRLLTSLGNQPVTISVYTEPRQYSRLGKGHLACLTYAGGRPISRRRNLASAEDYIRDDINVLSHYNRFRQAAEKASHSQDAEFGPISHPPPSMSPVTGSWKSNAPRRTQSDKVFSKPSESEGSADRKKTRREILEAEAMKEAEDEKRRKEELKRQEELAEQAAADRQAELERKAQQEEEERIMKEENERMEALKKAQEEEERRAKEEEEARLAKEEEERLAKEAEEKRKAKEEEERRAEEERKAREEEERRLKEEEERLAREEEERRLKEEEERLAREEEERRLKEEEEQRLRDEEEQKLKEEEEKRKREEEEAANKAAEEEAREEEEEEEPAEEKPEESNVAAAAAEESEGEPVIEEPTSPDEAPAKVFTEDEQEEDEEEEEEEE